MKFNDSYGFTDEKKIELIFSPTPSVQITGTDKLVPYLCGGGISLMDKQRAKTNIRLLYYNGVHACSGVNIGGDLLDGSTGVWHLDYTFSMDWYAQCSNYLFDESSDNSENVCSYSGRQEPDEKSKVNELVCKHGFRKGVKDV